jgi:protein phosphatase
MARVSAEPAMRGMATTLVIALVRDGVAWVANVGDSRGYLLREGAARQITEDHSLVAERVRAGRISPAQAAESPYRHFITRSIGGEEELEVDVFGPLTLQPGDRLLLCTDGLTETMTDEEFTPLALADDPEDAARALVDEANRRGGPDNISVLLVEAVGE